MSKTLNLLSEAKINPGDVVFVRIDCNVPLSENGTIADDFRLRAVIPTFKYLQDKGAKIIIAGAIGRPKGKRDDSLSTKCIAQYFESEIFEKCVHVEEVSGDLVHKEIDNLENGQALVLENLRFWSEEESNDENFAKSLAELADVYVNDAFGQSHRKQSSIVAITKFLPSYAGICLQKEVDALEGVLNSGEQPIVAIIGGAKVSDKLGVIEALLERSDTLIVGGAMAYTFLKSRGHKIGNSLCEDDYLDTARKVMSSGKILLPVDSVVADSIESENTLVLEEIPEGSAGFDIGPKSVEIFVNAIENAKTILWNGPMGVFEKHAFAEGTKEIANAVAKSDAFSVVGGGDSVAAIRGLKLEESINHVSTGGGATLEYIENGSLVGIEPLIK